MRKKLQQLIVTVHQYETRQLLSVGGGGGGCPSFGPIGDDKTGDSANRRFARSISSPSGPLISIRPLPPLHMTMMMRGKKRWGEREKKVGEGGEEKVVVAGGDDTFLRVRNGKKKRRPNGPRTNKKGNTHPHYSERKIVFQYPTKNAMLPHQKHNRVSLIQTGSKLEKYL